MNTTWSSKSKTWIDEYKTELTKADEVYREGLQHWIRVWNGYEGTKSVIMACLSKEKKTPEYQNSKRTTIATNKIKMERIEDSMNDMIDNSEWGKVSLTLMGLPDCTVDWSIALKILEKAEEGNEGAVVYVKRFIKKYKHLTNEHAQKLLKLWQWDLVLENHNLFDGLDYNSLVKYRIENLWFSRYLTQSLKNYRGLNKETFEIILEEVKENSMSDLIESINSFEWLDKEAFLKLINNYYFYPRLWDNYDYLSKKLRKNKERKKVFIWLDKDVAMTLLDGKDHTTQSIMFLVDNLDLFELDSEIAEILIEKWYWKYVLQASPEIFWFKKKEEK